jgi:hypothetical protein
LTFRKDPKAKVKAPKKEKEERKGKKADKYVDDELDGEWQKITHKDDPSKPLFDPKTEITAKVSVHFNC